MPFDDWLDRNAVTPPPEDVLPRAQAMVFVQRSVVEPSAIAPADRPRLTVVDAVRNAIRTRHYSPRTERAYVGWVRRFIAFHGRRHPRELGSDEVRAFLTALATRGVVSAGTQNQAFSALLFLYREVLDTPLEGLETTVRAKRPVRLPVGLFRRICG